MQQICYSCFNKYSGSGPCPHCGYDETTQRDKYPHALQPGSILNGRYIVGRVLGQGGFGITYIAWDDRNGELIAIKEYLPTEHAGRTHGSNSVRIYSGGLREFFDHGKEQFLEEAETLAGFRGNEHIVRVHSYFEENNTAYFAMEYVDGKSLDKYMSGFGGRLSPQAATKLLIPIMEALEWVHSKGVVHRDIAPDNILVTKSGVAKLIDFGAARYSTGEKSKSLDVILKHGFAPIEQYMRRGRQGSFTDIYAMAATYYYSITGKVPPEALQRLDEDELIVPSTLGVKMPSDAENVLLKALEVKAADRYQTMGEFVKAMRQTMAKEEQGTFRGGLSSAELKRIEEERKRLEEERRLFEEERKRFEEQQHREEERRRIEEERRLEEERKRYEAEQLRLEAERKRREAEQQRREEERKHREAEQQRREAERKRREEEKIKQRLEKAKQAEEKRQAQLAQKQQQEETRKQQGASGNANTTSKNPYLKYAIGALAAVVIIGVVIGSTGTKETDDTNVGTNSAITEIKPTEKPVPVINTQPVATPEAEVLPAEIVKNKIKSGNYHDAYEALLEWKEEEPSAGNSTEYANLLKELKYKLGSDEPENGETLERTIYVQGGGQLVVTAENGDAEVLIKDANEPERYVRFYVKKNQSALIYVPSSEYTLSYKIGDIWLNDEDGFGDYSKPQYYWQTLQFETTSDNAWITNTIWRITVS